jgi:hypothetical protein
MTHPAHSPKFLLLVATFLASAGIFGHIQTPEWLVMAMVLLGAAWVLVWWTPYRWRFVVATVFAFVGSLASARPRVEGPAADTTAVSFPPPPPYKPDGCLVMSNSQLVPCQTPPPSRPER